jgi:hypothetical protein
MSDVRIECKYRGRVRQPPSSEHWRRFVSRRPIGTRRIPAASDVATLPIATRDYDRGRDVALGEPASPILLTRARPIESSAPAATAAVELRPRLSGAQSPDDPRIARDPERLHAMDETLHGDHRKLLHEKARLDRAYHRLFLTALAYKVEPPLTLSNGGTTVPVFDDYTPDLQDFVGEPNWVPSSCSWRVEATLYEVHNAKSYAENSKAHGRSLKLPAPPDSRSDLVALPDSALDYPHGTSKKDYPHAFVVRAVELFH